MMLMRRSKVDIQCIKCGICCQQFNVPIDKKHRDKYVKKVGDHVEVHDMHVTIVGRCKYLDNTNKCSIYDKRFKFCKDYKCWEKVVPLLSGIKYVNILAETAKKLNTSVDKVHEYLLEQARKMTTTTNSTSTKKKEGDEGEN